MERNFKIILICLVILWLLFVLVAPLFRFYAGNFAALRVFVFVVALLAAYTAYTADRKIWLGLFVAIAIVFNPIIEFKFSRNIWQWIDFISLAVFGAFTWDYYNNRRKGELFERYIVNNIFPDWEIVDWTKDRGHWANGRVVESDKNPDLTLKHRTKGIIAVECKFRSYFHNGVFRWNKWQGKNYENYGKKNNMRVFVAIGVGGSPRNPNRLFFCPLQELNKCPSDFIPENFLLKYKINRSEPINP